jgi:HEAT repeat protein
VRNTALSDNDWEVRIRAIRVLENLRDKDAMRALLLCLRDKRKEIRYYSSNALKSLKFKKSARPISNYLCTEPDDEIKTILIESLIALNDPGGYRGLKKIISGDNNEKIRVYTAYALGIINKKQSETLLCDSLTDRSKEVRAEICHSLVYFNNKRVINKLLDIINYDSDLYVRSAALFTLKKIGGESEILPLFDRYAIESDPVFKEQIRRVIRVLIKRKRGRR